MKRLSILILIMFSVFGLQAQGIYEQALKEYQDENYRKAIELLETEIKSIKEESNEVSADLYYNLGNAYFRVNDIPEAILSYERALLYDPGDSDIRHNLEYANTHIEDKILIADNFFLDIWFESMQNLMSSDSWAVLSIILFILFIVCSSLYFLTTIIPLKKVGFYVGISLFVLLIFTNIFSYNQKQKIENRNTAIIMSGSVSVASSPTGNSKELFILHSGTKVDILKEDGDWYEIEIANGNIGWIKKNMADII